MSYGYVRPPQVRAVGLVSAAAAPVLLVGGWTLAASLRSDGYSAVRDTISALAQRGAPDRWVMTAAFGGLGVCHVVTAAALRGASGAGRLVLAAGGVATVLVAAFPLHADGGSSEHGIVATIAFVALAAWPALAWRRRARAWALRRGPALTATALLAAGTVWFAVELDGPRVGLAERVAAGTQAVWPLVAVLSARAPARR